MNAKSKKPRFTLIAAVSLDGRITAGSKEGTRWTSPEDKRWFHKELDRYDVVIMGRKTFEAIGRPLKPRNRIVFSRQHISPSKGSTAVSRLRRGFGGQVGRRGVLFLNHPTVQQLSNLLGEHRWTRIAVVGGTSIYDWSLKRNLVHEVYLTLEPVLFGSGKGISKVLQKPTRKFKLLSTKKLNSQGTLLLHYKSNN